MEVRRLAIGIAVALLVGLPGAALAAPSLHGPTGLVMIPTAEVLGMAQWNAGVTAVRIGDGADENVVYANLGLLPSFELGFARDKFEASEAETVVNAKLRLAGPFPGETSFAAGLIDITDQIDRSGYAVVSHTLGAGLLMREGQITAPQLHVGLGGGRFDGLFAGVSTTVNRRVGVMVEYDGEDFNAAAKWPLSVNLEATVAALDGVEDFGVGVSFSNPW